MAYPQYKGSVQIVETMPASPDPLTWYYDLSDATTPLKMMGLDGTLYRWENSNDPAGSFDFDLSGVSDGDTLIYNASTGKFEPGEAGGGGGGSSPVVESLGAGSSDPGNPVRWNAASTLILVVPSSGLDRYGVPAGTFANGDTVKVINNGGTANAYINTGPLWALLGVNKCAILTHYDGSWFADNY